MMTLLASIIVLTNIGYTVAFDTDLRQPTWVAYDLEPEEVVVAPRTDNSFVRDVRADGSDASADYVGSGYDRGHMAPAADFNWSTNALRETYLFSNVCPQSPALNRGRWREIEAEIRSLAQSGTVHVITAPYGMTTNHCGRIPVPAKFVKVAYGWFGFRLYVEDNREVCYNHH